MSASAHWANTNESPVAGCLLIIWALSREGVVLLLQLAGVSHLKQGGSKFKQWSNISMYASANVCDLKQVQ